MKTASNSLENLKNTLATIENLDAIKGGNDENPDRILRLTPRQLRDRLKGSAANALIKGGR